MAIVSKVFTGKITFNWDDDRFGDLFIGDNCIAQELAEDFDLEGKEVHLRYFVSDNSITDNPDELFLKTYFGRVEVEHEGLYGTEWTGRYGTDETLIIGDHDLHDELNEAEGKFCYVELWWME